MTTKPIAYICEAETYDRLQAALRRLYDERPLTGDERRDLANRFHALLAGMTPWRDQL